MDSEPVPRTGENEADNRTPEEKEEADMGAAVAKVGIIALIVGLFF